MTEQTQNRYNTKQNMVTASQAAPMVRRMSEAESNALNGIVSGNIQVSMPGVAPVAPQGIHSGHVRHNDDPITNVMASLRYSLAIAGVAAMTIGALLVLAIIQGYLDLGFSQAVGVEVVLTGIVTLVVMHANRAQGLHHSATGIAHAEPRATVAMHNRSAEVEDHRIDAELQVRLAEIQARRALGQDYLRYLEGPKQ